MESPSLSLPEARGSAPADIRRQQEDRSRAKGVEDQILKCDTCQKKLRRILCRESKQEEEPIGKEIDVIMCVVCCVESTLPYCSLYNV